MMHAIIIHTDADLTPRGKRRVRIVQTTHSGKPCAPRLRWYVGARVYRDLPMTQDNTAMSRDWLACGSA